MNFEIVVATTNENKMKEYREMIGNLPITLYSINDLNLNIEIEENGQTYFENALIKAQALKKYTSLPIMADDSGIEIEFLGKEFPGVNTHRYASSNGGFPAVDEFIIEKYKNETNRNAKYHCTIVVINLDKKPLRFDGDCYGKIDYSIKGGNGFGFDPIFISDDLGLNLGTVSDEEKNKISHRYKAFIKFITYLKIYEYI